MDFSFDSGFDDFQTDIEEITVKKVRKMDRMWRIEGGGSVCTVPAVDVDAEH